MSQLCEPGPVIFPVALWLNMSFWSLELWTAGMREKSPEGLSGQPRFLSGAERGARQEARRVAWILCHTSGLPPACVWWQGRSMAVPCFLEACCYLPCCPQLGVEGGLLTQLGRPEWQEVLGGFPLCPELSHPMPLPLLPSLPPQPSSARRKAAASLPSTVPEFFLKCTV